MSYTNGWPVPFCGRPVFDVQQTWLAGMTQVQLAQLLASLQNAMIAMAGGAKVTQASYTQGDGSKSVTFNMNSQAQIQSTINMVQKALGMPGMNRAPMRPRYL